MGNPCSDHNNLIIEQFTKQAIPFAKKSSQHIGEVFEKIHSLVYPQENDTVLDLASGSNLRVMFDMSICYKRAN
jgi:hypothetical protein